MEKILIVEDDKSMRENIVELLELNDFECVAADNGMQALKVIEEEEISFILSDIMMPELTGIELYKILKERTDTSQIPFVFLTAKSDPESQREGMNLGADDYIVKPYKAKDLVNAVEVRMNKFKKQKEKYQLLENKISKYIPHELRTPLGVIMGFSNMILENTDELTKTEIIDMVFRIKKSGERLHHRIEKLILLTEIDLDLEEKTEKNRKFDDVIECGNAKVGEMIFSTLQYYRREHDLTLDIGEAVLKINEFYFRRMIIEIVDNAFKFSKKNDKVILVGKKYGDKYRIEITDHGLGLTESEIKSISAFTQFNREVFQQEGNGLGFQIVTKILKLFNGSWQITSDENGKTTVTLELECVNN